MEEIRIKVENAGSYGQISVVRVEGYIDTTTSAELEKIVNSLFKAGRYMLIMDLSRIDYISSAGWGIFISQIREIRNQGGDLKLAGMISDVYEVFELLEFHRILNAFNTVEEAVREFEKGGKTPVSEPARINSVAPDDLNAPSVIATEEKQKVEETKVPATLSEKILEVVKNYPRYGPWRIKRILARPPYNSSEVRLREIRQELRRLDLGTKSKRLRYVQ